MYYIFPNNLSSYLMLVCAFLINKMFTGKSKENLKVLEKKGCTHTMKIIMIMFCAIFELS